MVVSSAPSSAYYSDLSVTAMPSGSGANERAYEIVGLTVMNHPLPLWDSGGLGGGGGGVAAAGGICTSSMSHTPPNSDLTMVATQKRTPRLAAINESSSTTPTTTVPSDYV